jgi:hypothetical protein
MRTPQKSTAAQTAAQPAAKISIISLGIGFMALLGCSSGQVSYRNVDSPAGFVDTYGAPRDKSFSMLADTNKELLHLTVLEQSKCDVIKVKLVDRVRETLKGDEVTHTDPPARIQMVQGIRGNIACEHRYARDVQVSLRIGETTYRLGNTSRLGELSVNLAEAVKPGLYPNPDSEAEVLIDWRDSGRIGRLSAGRFSLGELNKHETKLNDLVTQLEVLLARPNLNEPANLQTAYRLFAELHVLDTSGDARVAAVKARFIELFLARKAIEAAETVKRNLKALSEAKDLLKNSALTVPPYMHAALFEDNPTAMALQWALGEAVTQVRTNPQLCGSKFSWQNVSVSTPHARFAMTYLRYAMGDGFESDMGRLCTGLNAF